MWQAAAGMAGGVLGAGGQLIGGLLASDAAKSAAKKQAQALDQIYQFTLENLDPEVVNRLATKGDLAQVEARLNALKTYFPELATQEQLAQQKLTAQLGGIGSSAADAVAAQAAQEALAAQPEMSRIRANLLQNAVAESGGALPADIQAEFMKAGLEQAGTSLGSATAQGAGGDILRRVLGTGGLALRQQAANTLAAVQAADDARAQTLRNLFPALQQQQAGNIAATSGILQQANQMTPQAGLSGSELSNLFLSRIGALNSLTAQKAGVQAQGTLMSGLLQAGAIGSAAGLGQGATNYFGQLMQQNEDANKKKSDDQANKSALAALFL